MSLSQVQKALEECLLGGLSAHHAAVVDIDHLDGEDWKAVLARAHENAALAPLAVATLKALLGLPKEVFVARVKEFYPILTNLIASDIAPPEVQSSLSMLFSERVSNIVE